MKKSFNSIKVKRPIGFQLAAIFGLIVLLSLAAVTGISTYLMGSDVQITAENNNLSINMKASSTVNDKLSTIRANVFQLLDLTGVISSRTQALARQAETFFFERNDDIAFIYVISKDSVKSPLPSDVRITNNHFFISNEIDTSLINKVVASSAEQIARSCDGETIVMNVSPFMTVPSMALLFPWKENGRDQTCLIVFSIESISDIIGTGNINTTYLVNHADELLCHPDTERILAGESLRNHPLIVSIREHNQNNDDSRQIPFVKTDDKGKKTSWFGAYEKIGLGDVLVITEVSKDVVLDAVKKTFINNVFIMGCVFFLTLIIALVYSKFGISNPIKKLSFAAQEIQSGNFETEIIDELNSLRK
ncbi:MAG: adenylate/guanylate cyclase domain-containing protein, partial [Spirochaetia bacterium]|nr:adenylate/guanylate cyclase domain-containing protein [Spirochaetia bacterium]